jgi:hypothetical protein
MRPVPLQYSQFIEAGYNRVTLTGDINTDIGIICEDLRASLHEAVELARVQATEVSSEYNHFSFGTGTLEGANVSMDFISRRPELPAETTARLAKEEAERAKKEATLRKSRNRDLEKIRALALKHNLPLAITEGPHAHEANVGNQS